MAATAIQSRKAERPPDDERPCIYIEKGEQPRIAREAAGVLVRHESPIYLNGDALRRLVQVGDRAAKQSQIHHDCAATVLRPVSPGYLCYVLAEQAVWLRFDQRKGDYLPSDVPPRVAAMIIEAADELPFRRLKARAGCPQIMRDGEILRNGYHPEHQLLIEAPGSWVPPVPEPTKDDARREVEYLRRLLRYFPWESLEDQTAGLALLITAVIRPTLPVAPLFVISAPLSGPGTGKTLLSRAASIIATGIEPTTMTWPATPGEGAKRLDAAHLAGARMILIDNLSVGLDDDAICTALTSPHRDVRELGQSKTTSVPMQALHMATGNGVGVHGDLVRRTIRISLDPQTDAPDQRRIPQDLLAECREQRGMLVRAVHTLLRAYIQAGEPDMGLRPMGDFRDFTRRVRSPLVYAGLPDPVATQDAMRADDPKRQARQAMFTAWAAAFGTDGATAREAMELLEAPSGAAPMADDQLESLRDAVEVVATTAGRLDSRKLGRWLSRARDARFGDLVLTGRSAKGGRVRWIVDSGSVGVG